MSPEGGRMSSNERTLEYSMACAPLEAAGFLELIAHHLKDGNIMLRKGDDSLALQFGSRVKMKIEAKSKPEKNKGALEIELSWDGRTVKEKQDFSLEISSIEFTGPLSEDTTEEVGTI
jgi:amphi-Trp domain-containing protein